VMKKTIVFLVLCFILLTGCSTPAVMDVPASPITGEVGEVTSDDELKNMRADLVQVRADLKGAQIAYQDLLGVREIEVTDLSRRLGVVTQQRDESRVEYSSLWDTYQGVVREKVALQEELVRTRGDLSEVQGGSDVIAQLEVEYSVLQTSYERTLVERDASQSECSDLQRVIDIVHSNTGEVILVDKSLAPGQPGEFGITSHGVTWRFLPGVPRFRYDALRSRCDVLELERSSLQSERDTLSSKLTKLRADLNRILRGRLGLQWPFGTSQVEKDAFFDIWEYWTGCRGWLKW